MISWVALDRIAEETAKTDKDIREKLAGRPLRSRSRYMNDAQLVAGLRSFGISIDRSSLERLCHEHLSAEEMARPLIRRIAFKTMEDELQGDWIYVYLDALWRRWFPEIPSFEILDDKMQEGYELAKSGYLMAACRIWLEAWEAVLYFFNYKRFGSISEFDASFNGTQSLFNWIQDLKHHLWNASLQDRRLHKARVALGEAALGMIEGDNEATDGRFQSMLETFRVSVAESYFELGETARTDSLYHEWLDGDPQWGAGWIEWSDHYRFTQTLARNLERAEELLKEGLSVSGVRDFDTLTERLATIQEDKQKEVEQQSTGEGVTVLPLEKTASQSEKINVIQFSARGASSRAADLNRVSSTPQSYSFGKIGRNDPCSCGSGKKFKKCCGGKM